MMKPSFVLLALPIALTLYSCGDEFSGVAQFHGSGDGRPMVSKHLLQGEVGDQFGQIGEVQVEEFQQNTDDAKLDLLIVIDNSGSMRDEQANLATKLAPLLSHIQDVDWRIAVATTDESDDCLRPDGIINHDEENISERFSKAIQAGINGSGYEYGLLQAVRALSMRPPIARVKPCRDSTPWVRDNSTVAVLIVSDEDNCSQSGLGSDCIGEIHRNPSFLIDYLSSIREVGVTARVYGLIWQPGVVCRTGANVGNTYDTVIRATGGTSGSICDLDYTPTLEAISRDLSVLLESRFQLKMAADPSSLEVFVDGEKAIIDFRVFGNVVMFREPPPAGSQVTVKYRPLHVEVQRRFPLSQDFDGKIYVKVDDVLLEASEYSIDPRTNELVLRNMPPRNAEIRIYYGEEKIVRSSFRIDPNVRETTLRVYVNKKEVKNFTYNARSGLITFREAPPENADILATYVR